MGVQTLDKIKEFRKERGISRRELAANLNVTQASVSRWEQNQLSINGGNLIKLAKYFGVSVDSLLGIGSKK